MIAAVQPVLLVPGGIAPDAHAAALRASIPAIQAWWLHRGGVYLCIGDPLTPVCTEPWAWFRDYPGGPFYAAQEWVIRKGMRDRAGRVLVFLKGYPGWHGEAGPTVAVCGYGCVEELATAALDNYHADGDAAAGLVSHEIGHVLGLGHLNQPGELMHGGNDVWRRWPDCLLSVKPGEGE